MSNLSTIIVTNVAIAGFATWLLKLAIEKKFESLARRHEHQLGILRDKEMHRFGKIYDEQISVLKDIYAQIVDLHREAMSLGFHYHFYEQHPELLEDLRRPKDGDPRAWQRFLSRSLGPRQEDNRASDLSQRALAALKAFEPNRIYVDSHFANEIERLLILLEHVGAGFPNVNHRDPDTLEHIVNKEVVTAWTRALSACQKLIPELEDKIREQLARAS